MKKLLLLCTMLIAMQVHAQFSYSIKAGWSWPSTNSNALKEYSRPTFGVNIDYSFNGYLGLQTGINYKRICELEEPVYDLGGAIEKNEKPLYKKHGSFVEIPILLSVSTVPAPQKWRAIWYAGGFIDIPIEQYSPNESFQTFYGIMAVVSLEIKSHYFIRGEYQWALSSDLKGMRDYTNRKAKILSVCLGYRF